MTPKTQTTTWQEPIVQELHVLREQLVEQYNGDIHAYAQACERKVQSLGIVFKRLPVRQFVAAPLRG
jgi:hypothetical protein